MAPIGEFICNISKEEGLKDLLPLKFNVYSKIGTFNSEDNVMSKLLWKKDRLSTGSPIDYFTFTLMSAEGRVIISFTLREFPSCCGKIILHGMSLSGIHYTPKDIIVIKPSLAIAMTKGMLDLASKIAKIYGYSSLDFIVSDVEQPVLLNCVKALGIKEVSYFRNQRNQKKHTCYTYTLPIAEDETAESVQEAISEAVN